MNATEREIRRASILRDRHIAAEILKKRGEGIVAYGANHKLNLERELVEQCRRSLSGAGPGTPAVQ